MNSPVDPSTGNREGVVQHTPGPWFYREDRTDDRFKRFVSCNTDARGEPLPGRSENGRIFIAHTLGPDCEANARLIAAAPELLKALESFVAPFAGTTDERLRDRAPHTEAAARVLAGRAAIAKATASNPPTTPPTEQDQ